jgi:predicted RNase H-like HicB family nuclease
MSAATEFVAVIHENEDGEFVLQFPDLPECSAVAPTEDEARSIAADVLAEGLDAIRRFGEIIPKPSTFTAILADPKWCVGRSVRVRAAFRNLGAASDD